MPESNPTPEQGDSEMDSFILNEVQLLLSEKRTALSTLRTGIAIFAFPLSVLSVLIATSKVYKPAEVMQWLLPLLVLNLGLVALAVYLIVTAMRHIHHYDRLIAELKRRYSKLAALLD